MDIYDRCYQQRKQTATLQLLKDGLVLPAAGSVCLELGCGNGAMASLFMARAGYQVYGVDISPTAIGWAQETYSAAGLAADFQRGDVCDLDRYHEQQFDLAFDGSCPALPDRRPATALLPAN